jgi:hypothetical protein
LSPKGGLVRKMICNYDSLFRPTGKGFYNEFDELEEYFNIEYDSLGRITSTQTASFRDQHEERVDYFYNINGIPEKAIGYFNINATSNGEKSFVVTFSNKQIK